MFIPNHISLTGRCSLEVLSISAKQELSQNEANGRRVWRRRKLSLQAKNISWYLPLYEVALKGDWESANRFFDLHPDAIIVKLPQVHMTALHIAVGAGHSNHFVEKLVELMPLKALQLQTEEGDSALAYAAITGNTTAVEIIIRKDPNLPNMQNAKGKIPLRYAAQHGHRDTVVSSICH
ncbi:hypothetical protein GIB67_022226 [Kingdonia uniflora]|uniref:Uncharacterized protein n=1 Tax=Kingdonia uniflora TaxID=39325 RepID=A0A7J7M764_9MAGN|nr:hypothetical protein GIB67_022226 [Kingdonia uniflora]